jgi:hypothetical protein
MAKPKKIYRAQAAIEYLLLLGAVSVTVLLAFKTLLPQQLNQSEIFFNDAARSIMGESAENKVRTYNWVTP